MIPVSRLPASVLRLTCYRDDMRRLDLLATLLLAACAAKPQADQDEISRLVAAGPSGPDQQCVSLMPSQRLIIVDRGTVAYRSGTTIWLNRLQGHCPGMDPFDTLILEVLGSQACRGDRIRVVEFGGSIQGPICLLGDFKPYK